MSLSTRIGPTVPEHTHAGSPLLEPVPDYRAGFVLITRCQRLASERHLVGIRKPAQRPYEASRRYPSLRSGR